MTEQEFRRISMFIKSRYGIDMTSKKEIMEGRLTNILRRLAMDSYSDYMNAVEADITGELEKELVNTLTTNHTYFMREFEHFDFLRTQILPWLKQTEAESRDLRIWCGAASTGEEPYMIAMMLLDYFGLEKSRWDTKVLATDLSTDVLQTAVRGIYKKEAIQGLPESWKRRFTKSLPDSEYCEMTQELKNEVLFRQFNLMSPFPFRKKMHVVFLRNVMIYFDHPTKRELIRKIYDNLVPGGYLIIGKTETIEREGTEFEMIRPSIFRKPL